MKGSDSPAIIVAGGTSSWERTVQRAADMTVAYRAKFDPDAPPYRVRKIRRPVRWSLGERIPADRVAVWYVLSPYGEIR